MTPHPSRKGSDSIHAREMAQKLKGSLFSARNDLDAAERMQVWERKLENWAWGACTSELTQHSPPLLLLEFRMEGGCCVALN